MVQNQLVEYISSQLKAGLSRDTIKASLVGAGWQAADVDDTFKQVEGSFGVTSAAGSSAAPASAATKSAEPQSIKVSDLISTSEFGPSSSQATSSPSSSPMKSPAMMSTNPGGTVSSVASSSVKPSMDSKPIGSLNQNQDKSSKTMFTPSAKSGAAGAPSSFSAGASSAGSSAGTTSFFASSPKGSAASLEYPPKTHTVHTALFTEVILGIVVVIVGGLAAFFYAQDSALASKVSSLTASSASLTSQLQSFQDHMNASTSDLTAQMATLTAANQALMTDLSFYAAVPGSIATSSPATFTGTVAGGGRVPYAITDKYGARIYVGNSKAAGVVSSFTSAMASSTPVTVEGTYVPGSDTITVTQVNGTSVQ